MAASVILAKFGTATALTITLASLASSTVGVGRQSTLVDNTSDRFQKVHVYFDIVAGTSPTANKGFYAYLLKADKFTSPDTATDGAGASDAGITIVSAQQIAASGPTTTTTNQAYQFDCIINNPGPCWGIAIVHDTGVAIKSSGAGGIWYVGENPEAQ